MKSQQLTLPKEHASNPDIVEMLGCITATDEKIAFCFKLWVKELIESECGIDKKNGADWVISHALNEILNGDYCSDDEFNNRNKIFPPSLQVSRHT